MNLKKTKERYMGVFERGKQREKLCKYNLKKIKMEIEKLKLPSLHYRAHENGKRKMKIWTLLPHNEQKLNHSNKCVFCYLFAHDQTS